MMTLIVLLSIMEELCRHELLNFVRDCVHRVVSKVWAGLVDVWDMSR